MNMKRDIESFFNHGSKGVYDSYVFTVKLIISDCDGSIKYYNLFSSGDGYILTESAKNSIRIQIPGYADIIGIVLISNNSYFGFKFPKSIVFDDEFNKFSNHQNSILEFIQFKFPTEYSEFLKYYYDCINEHVYKYKEEYSEFLNHYYEYFRDFNNVVEALYMAYKFFKWEPYALTEGVMNTIHGSFLLSVSKDGYVYMPKTVSFRKMFLSYGEMTWEYKFPCQINIENIENQYVDAISVKSFLSQIINQLGPKFNWDKSIDCNDNSDILKIPYSGYIISIKEPKDSIEKIKIFLDSIFDMNNWEKRIWY